MSVGRLLCNSLVWRYFAFPSLKTHLCVYRPKLFFWFLLVPFAMLLLLLFVRNAHNLILHHSPWARYTENETETQLKRKNNTNNNILLRHFSMHLPFFALQHFHFRFHFHFHFFFIHFDFCPMFKCFFSGQLDRKKKWENGRQLSERAEKQ